MDFDLLKQSSILLVDDNPVNLKVLYDYFSPIGLKVYIAQDGKSAISQCLSNPPDLIITDLLMPEMNGYELTRELKALEQTAGIPVLMMSALSETEDKIKGFQAGAVDYITKPFQKEEVLARVHTHLLIKKQQKELEKLVNEDALTSLYNRRFILELLDKEFSRGKRDKSMFSLIIFDIDHFKRLNDTYGHLSGDKALRLISETIVKTIRGYDSCGRFGGEEFLLILPATGLKEAAQVAEKLRIEIMNLPFKVNDENVQITASFGVCEYSPEYSNSEELVSLADQKLYEAKETGRNKVCIVESKT